MIKNNVPKRCRLVLITPPPGPEVAEKLDAALNGGDVATVIVPQYDCDDATFQQYAEKLTKLTQEHNVAVIIAGEVRVAARAQADGIQIEVPFEEAEEMVERYHSKFMIGCAGIKTRDDALSLGELQPDYIFLGKFGYDNKPEAHPRNLTLATWWAEMIEVPCVVMGGSDPESALEIAKTGADFAALCSAVFADGVDPAATVASINSLLDAEAPQFA